MYLLVEIQNEMEIHTIHFLNHVAYIFYYQKYQNSEV